MDYARPSGQEVTILDPNTKPTEPAKTPPAMDEAAHFVPHPDNTSVPPVSPASPPNPAPGLMRPMLAGLAGGAVAFGIFFALSQLLNPMADLSDRLAIAESNIATAATRRALETTDKRLAALEARFDPLRSELETINRTLNGAGTVDVTPLVRRLSALENSIVLLKQDTQNDKPAAASPVVTSPVATSALGFETAKLSLALLISDRLEAGQPFLSELAALELLGVDAAIQPLVHDTANGNPSQVQLLGQFAGLIPQLRKAIPIPADQGWSAKIWQSLSMLVRIRRLDDNQATDPESRMHLITLALQAGRTDEALKHFNLLPDAMRAQARDFEALLHKRLAAVMAGEALLKSASEDLLAASRTAKGGSK